MKYLLIILLLTVPATYKAVAAKVNYDKTVVKPVLPAEEKVKAYLDDSDFDYKTDVVPSESIMDRIWMWIWRIIDTIFSDEGAAPIIRYTIIIGFIIFIILRFLNVKPRSLFVKNKKQKSVLVNEDDAEIMEADIDELIRKELANSNYRHAVRLLYLKLLKTLSNKEIINWQINKTNYDYQKELSSTAYSTGFAKLSLVFEFVWYGNFTVEKTAFDNIHSEFNSIIGKLNE